MTFSGIVILQLGRTYADMAAARGDFDQWTADGLALPSSQIQVVDVAGGDPIPEPRQAAGFVLTGSHDMVTDQLPWSEKTADWLRRAARQNTPVLGICYGHQLMADALGGAAGDLPRGSEYGTVEIELTGAAADDPLFAGLPSPLAAQVCHRQTALRLPPGATVLAASRFDPHQAVRFGPAMWGVQFHPEFDAWAMRAYTERCTEPLCNPEQSLASILQTIAETPRARSILSRFARLAVG